MKSSDQDQLVVGQWVEGIEVPVVNERAVRASAGILFLGGFTAWLWGVITGDLQPMRVFGIVFALEMMLRLFVGTAFTPTLILGTLITRRQRPEWVEARSKLLAWRLGLGMSLVGCLSLGWFGLPAIIAQVICGACLFLIYLEASFGICVGCMAAQRFSRRSPQLCAGDTCTYTPPARGEQHSILRD
ncbi:DUF4395 domain-containing protein [Microbacterium immunditiarum]|uniref:DUF4395 domain-containing protein n=1 Tax=Microbacterium immunditiarum TaxID=337480 RepID=A0A7Y9GRW0_9MICO|nr:DUF4395 domain-containing protein [Microbacterium immunditiarum]NYE21558.1 hypothetical protein [Microbacterium immunditiarum]